MIAFLRKNPLLVGSLFSLLCSITLLAGFATGRLRLDPGAVFLLNFMRPFQKAAQETASWAGGFRDRYIAFWGLREENERLKRRLMELEAERSRFLEAEATNRRLSALLELKSAIATASISATVIGNSASGWFRSVTIDKGSQDGLRKGMAVVTPLGVVGQVMAVASRSSKVLLLTDQNSAVDVVDQRSRAQGIVSGSLEEDAVMKYVKRSEDVQVGDRLITSGLDGIYPKGFPVGAVSRLNKKGYGLFQTVDVTLAADPSRIEEVQVISQLQSRGD